MVLGRNISRKVNLRTDSIAGLKQAINHVACMVLSETLNALVHDDDPVFDTAGLEELLVDHVPLAVSRYLAWGEATNVSIKFVHIRHSAASSRGHTEESAASEYARRPTEHLASREHEAQIAVNRD